MKRFGDWREFKWLMDVRINDAFDESVISANGRDEYYLKTEEIGECIAKKHRLAYHDRLVIKDDKYLSKKAIGLVKRLKRWLEEQGIPTSPDSAALAA